MAAAMDHIIEAPDGHAYELTVTEDSARLTTGCRLEAGQRLALTKFVSYGWSSQRSMRALTDQTGAALVSALHAGWDALAEEQRNALDLFWDCADVEIDGAPAIQQAVRFALFHTLQAGLRAEQRAIPAKGLTGPGYDGHAFWDTETFVLPVLTATSPNAARDALRWRWSTLDLARERAETLHLHGAVFPWRTIRGQETSGYWPAGTAAMHLNADIALAVQRYVDWTQDEQFEQRYGLAMLVETARLWIALGYHGEDGKFHIDGVTGPDEYSAIVRDNTFTNLAAARNLAAAADCRRALAASRRRARRDATRDQRVARGGGRDRDAVRSPNATSISRIAGRPTARCGTSRRHCAPGTTRCCCTRRTSRSTASRSSSRPTSCSPCIGSATRSARRRRLARSTTTSD